MKLELNDQLLFSRTLYEEKHKQHPCRFVFNLRNATGGLMLWITKGTTTIYMGASASQAPTLMALILLRCTMKTEEVNHHKNRSLLKVSCSKKHIKT